MKSLKALSLFLIITFLSSCANDLNHKSWKNILEHVKNDKIDILVSNGVQLLSYEMVDRTNPENIARVRKEFADQKNYFPYYTHGRDKFRVITLAEAFRNKPDDIKADNYQGPEFFDQIIIPGLDIIELKWKVGNVIIFTKCLVSSQKGIVFDYMLSNIWIFPQNDRITEKHDTINIKHSKANNGQDTTIYTIDKSWMVRKTAETLSGKDNELSISYSFSYESKKLESRTVSRKIIGTKGGGFGRSSREGGNSGAKITMGTCSADSLEINWNCWWTVYGAYEPSQNTESGIELNGPYLVSKPTYPCGLTETGKVRIHASDL